MYTNRPAHNRIDLTGQRFGQLLDVERCQERAHRQCLWLCQCDCGKTSKVIGTQLRKGRAKSCGCLRHKPCARYRGLGELSGSYWYMVKHHAFSRDLEFDITIEQAWELYLSQDRKCALSGVPLVFVRKYREDKRHQTASLDRIDSSQGYFISNVQWVHKDVNNMKQDIPQDVFLSWCRRISVTHPNG